MPSHIVEERLDVAERQFEDWRCLMAIATGISLPAIWIVLILKQSSLGIYDLLAIALSLLFVWGVSRLWPAVVLAGALGIALVFVTGLIHNTLGPYQNSQSSPTLLHWILYAAGMAAMFVPLLMMAWRIARTSPTDRAIIALPKSHSFGLEAAVMALFGVPPIVGHLPTPPRQIGAACLFFLCQSIIAFSIFMLILIGSTLFLNTWRALECFSSSATVASCSGSLSGEIMSPAIWLGIPIALAVGCRQIARRFARTSAEQLRSHDSRPPLLFLRSFSDDQVRLKKPRRHPFNRLFLLGEPRPLLDHILLEEGTRLGPIVAIGAPGSRPPFGIARAYVEGDAWRDAVGELALGAQLIFIAVDETDGVKWELSEIHGRKFTSKVLHLLPPRLTQPGEARRVVEVVRTKSSEIFELFAPLVQFLATNDRPCLGWHFDATGGLTVFTTAQASEVSYLIAVRKYLGSVGKAA